jgi:hypothetical protein
VIFSPWQEANAFGSGRGSTSRPKPASWYPGSVSARPPCAWCPVTLRHPGGASMKRVRFIAGVAALAPAAIGTAILPTVHAATDTRPTAQAKGVSLYHLLSSCDGNHQFSRNYKNLEMVGYSAVGGMLGSKICIGTVNGYVTFNKSFCKDATLTVSSHPAMGIQNPVWGPKTHKVCGKKGEVVKTVFTPHVETNVSDFPGAVALSSTYQTRRNHEAVSYSFGPCPPC